MAKSSRQRFSEYVGRHSWPAVGAAEWEELRAEFPDVPESTARRLLTDSGRKIAQPWRGVETKTLDELADSLCEMARLYQDDAPLRKTARDIVIHAKDRARFAARNPRVDPVKRELKEEMVQWMLVWLADPAMFALWVEKRRRVLSQMPS